MASLKQITVGTTSYDIIPSAITDSNANYKASCPTISSDTTVEVDSNKTTVINSSSTDTEYPSAKAVYTAIKKASKAGAFASNIFTGADSSFVPLISTSGMFSTTYLQNLGIPNNKRIDGISSGSNTTIGYMATAGKITQFNLSGGTIGDSTIPTTSDTTIGQNGLYGSGATIYIAATGAADNYDQAHSGYAFTGSIINKAGISSSVQGGYIKSINNNAYATINQIQNVSKGTITNIENSGYIGQMHNTGTINYLYADGGSVTAIVGQGSTAGVNLGPSSTYPLWDVVVNGKVNPWQEVSNIDSLITFLNLQTGILYKYTGFTITDHGITYTKGNFYRYEA